jgi:hypothetical protein
MSSAIGHSSAARAPRRRGTVLLGVAGGAVLAVLLVAVGTPGAGSDEPLPEPLQVDTAPAAAAADAAAQRVATLDAAVDWSRVEHAREEAGASIAAYER